MGCEMLNVGVGHRLRDGDQGEKIGGVSWLYEVGGEKDGALDLKSIRCWGAIGGWVIRAEGEVVIVDQALDFSCLDNRIESCGEFRNLDYFCLNGSANT